MGFTRKEKMVMKTWFIICILIIGYIGYIGRNKPNIYICRDKKKDIAYYCDKVNYELIKLKNIAITNKIEWF